MKNSLYYTAQRVVVVLSLFWVYLATLEMELFPWGRYNLEHMEDGKGWNLVPVLFLVFPLMLFFLLVKYWALRKMEGVFFYRLTPLFILIMMAMMFFNVSYEGMDENAVALLLGLGTATFSIVETIWFAQGKTPWRNTTSG